LENILRNVASGNPLKKSALKSVFRNKFKGKIENLGGLKNMGGEKRKHKKIACSLKHKQLETNLTLLFRPF
jgi:hypothetical protein